MIGCDRGCVSVGLVWLVFGRRAMILSWNVCSLLLGMVVNYSFDLLVYAELVWDALIRI